MVIGFFPPESKLTRTTSRSERNEKPSGRHVGVKYEYIAQAIHKDHASHPVVVTKWSS